MKERTILINKAPFTYLDEVGDPYVFNVSTQQELIELLKLSTKLLDICGICYCLTYGTLLGAVREGSIIKGDADVDIIVTDEDRLFSSLPLFSEHGLFINRIFTSELYSFHTDGRKGHVDMYIMKPINKRLYKNWCVSISGHYTPKRFFMGIDKDHYQIDGIFYPCPQNPENLLSWYYGKSWRIPQSKQAKSGVFPQRLVKFPSKTWGRIKRKIQRMRAGM